MNKGFGVPSRFTEMIKHCYVAVPLGGSFTHPETNGFINGFDDIRIIRDLYDLWVYVHARVAKLKKVPRYYAIEDPEKVESQDLPTWARREICHILNAKFAGNATFEWFERNEEGDLVKTNGFDWIDVSRLDVFHELLLNQTPLMCLFDFPENNLTQAWGLYKEVTNREGWLPPTKTLVEYERKHRKHSTEKKHQHPPFFVPIEKIISGETTDFVPYISPLSAT